MKILGKLLGEPRPLFQPVRLTPLEYAVIAICAAGIVGGGVYLLSVWINSAP